LEAILLLLVLELYRVITYAYIAKTWHNTSI